MELRTQHSCKMPRRRSRWKNRIYICKCSTGWTAKYYQSQGAMAEAPSGGYYLWHPVELTIGEAVYIHG